ncbi:MAG TPA: rhodanese-like domain-containing protein [Candidatus Dormibacteraeota bacterium]|jgi:rhodanese-related sulfurtransferase
MREADPNEAQRLMAEGATLLDVREADEWAAGHAPGAVHIPLSSLDPTEAPEGQPLLTVCRSGRRSAEALTQLSAGGREVINVSGGMVAWRDAGLPVVTDDGAHGRIA